ncbi:MULTISPECIES: SPOR domain-containing protein [unclassified Pseudomonas]|uniref:SPOR domain-containing protein n=1 Tax=unclassified Pseudomonas TaxID=196821 RepID=UPI00244D065A|nr:MULTISPECIES: SPOR domain-containing protein [unclassified Pseudomonas]MDG9925010.1 SPOR domain-containing protein [Pseudomonas sp. GD04045]MDH0037115.1 SPOR domain-containing protein [Pseudomonas sp. GD04019]
MRWFFLLLLVLNLFYYVWHQQQAPLRIKEVEPMALYKGERQGIRLLDAADRAKTRPELVQPSSAVDETCLFLGSFQGEDAARQIEQRLIALDIEAQVRAVDAAAGLDYWVYLAPLASRQASLRQLKELQARKIDSYIITQGDLANGISLGIFPRSDSAESVMQRLRDAGYEPMLRELPRAQRSFWVRVAPESRRLADDVLQQLASDFKDLQHQIMPCESVASAQ